jgi:peptidoglycan/LPS O-acetylase OafA/YrhL
MAENSKKFDLNQVSMLSRISFLIIGLAITFIVYGPLEGILITRTICICICVITLMVIVCVLYENQDIFVNLWTSITLIALLMTILIVYMSYTNISFASNKYNNILNHSYSNTFIKIFVLLCFYLSYYFDFDMQSTTYVIIVIASCLMAMLLYPLITIVRYYKTDGFQNIYI